MMYFEGSSNVTLLFDFWSVHEPGGMVLSVFVVLLLTVIYELLKVWKNTLAQQSTHPPAPSTPTAISTSPPCFSPELEHPENSPTLTNSPSEISLTPTENTATTAVITPTINSWLLHSLQTGLHIVQVVLGYMLMLCVMSYNIWIFLGVIVGSLLGYFFAFPLLSHVKRQT
ncbi:probable low affinity copper uptake protein 2 [Colossoma macropomum]|uniref:probable low affinity copper uptake protein 2 n=1 Tax=Colossoma macropomum TaxID=42526 RepID=UPI001864FF87|nr:probable low affinity copper uptake protein 2 [Colossoma macropomum]